jgi:hypothetical protein
MPQYALRTVVFQLTIPATISLFGPRLGWWPLYAASSFHIGNGIGSPKDRFQPSSATGAPVWRHQLTPDQSAATFFAATVCGEAGFCHEDLFMSNSGMPIGCAGGLAGAPRKWSFWKLTLRRAASSRLEMLNWWNERQVRSAKWPFGVIGNPQINFKQISTPVRYHPRII